MKEMLLAGATKLVEDLAGVKPGENVLIITDYSRDFEIAETIAVVAAERGAEVTAAMIMHERHSRVPAVIQAALREANVVFDLTPDYRLWASEEGRLGACARGSRYMCIMGATADMLVSGGLTADFEHQKRVVEKLANRMRAATNVTVTTLAGTHVSFSVEGRLVNEMTGFCLTPGSASVAPDIEVCTTPMEETVNGVIVVDLSVGLLGIVKDPVTLTIKKGKTMQVQGGSSAHELSALLQKERDPNVYCIGEFAIGLNPRSRLTGDVVETVCLLGTCHFALGHNLHLGGRIRAPAHHNIQMRAPTITFDGEPVMKSGELLV